ncbi:unnamed protein product [Ostreobium quekettii]|uniref:RING-type domain-containing protein n=1 Tax=Ostreobium quekettii TaxID=121088 RepID=A0A8S1IKS0_9CHLO|nr:unnamed protein product [Ostreobium quekettii]
MTPSEGGSGFAALPPSTADQSHPSDVLPAGAPGLSGGDVRIRRSGGRREFPALSDVAHRGPVPAAVNGDWGNSDHLPNARPAHGGTRLPGPQLRGPAAAAGSVPGHGDRGGWGRVLPGPRHSAATLGFRGASQLGALPGHSDAGHQLGNRRWMEAGDGLGHRHLCGNLPAPVEYGGLSYDPGRNGAHGDTGGRRARLNCPSGLYQEGPSMWQESAHANGQGERMAEGAASAVFHPPSDPAHQHRPCPRPQCAGWDTVSTGTHAPYVSHHSLDVHNPHLGLHAPFPGHGETPRFPGYSTGVGNWHQNVQGSLGHLAGCPAGMMYGMVNGSWWEGQSGSGMATGARRGAWNEGGYNSACEPAVPIGQHCWWQPGMMGSTVPLPPPPQFRPLDSSCPSRGREWPDSERNVDSRHHGMHVDTSWLDATHRYLCDIEFELRAQMSGGMTDESHWDNLRLAGADPEALLPIELAMQDLLDFEAADGLDAEQFARIMEITVGKELTIDDLTSLMDRDTPQCCICIEGFRDGEKVRVLPCNHQHMFHTSCIWGWLKEHHECPICRGDLNVLMELLDARQQWAAPSTIQTPAEPDAELGPQEQIADSAASSHEDDSCPPEWHLDTWNQSKFGFQTCPSVGTAQATSAGLFGQGQWGEQGAQAGPSTPSKPPPAPQAADSKPKDAKWPPPGRSGEPAILRPRRSLPLTDPATLSDAVASTDDGPDGKLAGGPIDRSRVSAPRTSGRAQCGDGAAHTALDDSLCAPDSAPVAPVAGSEVPPLCGGREEGCAVVDPACELDRGCLSFRDPVVAGPPRGSHNRAVGSPVGPQPPGGGSTGLAGGAPRAKGLMRHLSADAGGFVTAEERAPWRALGGEGVRGLDPGDHGLDGGGKVAWGA